MYEVYSNKHLLLFHNKPGLGLLKTYYFTASHKINLFSDFSVWSLSDFFIYRFDFSRGQLDFQVCMFFI